MFGKNSGNTPQRDAAIYTAGRCAKQYDPSHISFLGSIGNYPVNRDEEQYLLLKPEMPADVPNARQHEMAASVEDQS